MRISDDDMERISEADPCWIEANSHTVSDWLDDLVDDLRDARAACREAVAKYFDHPDTQEAHDAEYEAMLKLRAVVGEEAKP